MEAFSRYLPLFSDALGDNRIGVCKWIESGNTIDTALPELRDLTDDKEEWRAIIVRYEDDNCMASFETDVRNPYDFIVSRDAPDAIEESPVPLVRLTNMLGGIPPLEVKFRMEVVREPRKAPHTIYVPVEDPRQEQRHRELSEKYRFDGRSPSSILLLTIRDKSRQSESIGRSWLAHNESDSSEFWKRNLFPSICRFLVYDVEDQGPVQKEADDFGFWYSLLLLSLNEWDPGTLQAYRLYSMALSMDRSAMAESFQALSDKLRCAKRSVEAGLKKDIELSACEEMELPDFRINISVPLDMPDTEDRVIEPASFSLVSDGIASDTAAWNDFREDAEEELEDAVRHAERILDRTAEKVCPDCACDEDEVAPLGRYQTEDLKRENDRLYEAIVMLQGTLPKDTVTADAGLQAASDKVRQNLSGRITGRGAVTAVLLSAGLLLACAVPALITGLREDTQSLEVLACVFAGSLLAVMLAALLVLLFQKSHLNSLIENYNQCLTNAYNELVHNAGGYSDYLSNIASLSRGSSYLSISRRKKLAVNSGHYMKYKHIRSINSLLGRLKLWSRAYHLDVDFDSVIPDDIVTVDTAVPPAENRMYSFSSGRQYPVPVNNSGITLDSPFRFVSRVMITREELYEDE